MTNLLFDTSKVNPLTPDLSVTNFMFVVVVDSKSQRKRNAKWFCFLTLQVMFFFISQPLIDRNTHTKPWKTFAAFKFFHISVIFVNFISV